KMEAVSEDLHRIAHPEFEVLEPDGDQELQKILPVYLRPGGLSLSLMRKWIGHALAEYGSLIPSYLPPPTMKRQGLISLTQALAQLHQPDAQADPAVLNDGYTLAHR